MWIAIAGIAVGLPSASLAAAGDGDGIPDAIDKCTLDSRNASATCDTDGDGYGSVCDPDFDQNFTTNAVDFSMFFIPSFKTVNPAPLAPTWTAMAR